MVISKPLTEAGKEDIRSWAYEGRYAVYNLPQDYTFSSGLFYELHLDAERIGYVHFREEVETIMLGMGLRPDLCGKGLGTEVLKAVFRISESVYPEKPLSLAVRSWNQRAVRCYQKAGFFPRGEEFEMNTPGGRDRFINMITKERGRE